MASASRTVRQMIAGTDRFLTRTDWLESRRSFSFGDDDDPDNTHHGVLLVSNEELVSPLYGFDTHPHRNAEIVTWMVSGSLVHQDSHGHSGIVYPGLAQRMSAGSGVRHSERNDRWAPGDRAVTAPSHFIQMQILPDEPDTDPGYEQSDIGAVLAEGGLIPVASGMTHQDSAIRIGNRDATMYVARLSPGESVTLPDLPYGHVFVAAGTAHLEAVGELTAGDAVRITAGGGERLTGRTDCEVIVWEMRRRLGD